MSDKKVEDLTLLTLRNHKKHKNMQNLSYYYDLKWMFSSMEIINCDGLSQFYFEQPNWLWGISLRTMIIPYFILRACEYVKKEIANFYQFCRVADVQEGK